MLSRVVSARAVLGASLAAAVSLWSGAAGAGKPRIAVVGLKAIGAATADLRERMDAAVAGGLAASGAEVVDSATTKAAIGARGMAGCETPSCLAAIGQASGATHVVRGSIEVEGRSYTVRLELLEAVTGAEVERREDRCEICTEAEAFETASVSASALKAQVFKRRPTVGMAGAAVNTPAGAPPVTQVTPAAVVTDSSSTISTSPAPPSPSPLQSKSDRFRALGWVAVGAAVLAVSAGITLMVIDGQQTCLRADPLEQCEMERDTMKGGVSLTALGIAAATVGILTLSGSF